MSEGDRVFRIVTRSLVGLLVVGLIAIGVVIWATRMGYLPPASPTPEPELTPLERFIAEFREGEITIKAWFVGATLLRLNEKPTAVLIWEVEETNQYPGILYKTYTQDPDFITVLELFTTNSIDRGDIQFKVTLHQEAYHLYGGDAFFPTVRFNVDGTLIWIGRQSEDAYAFWQPFTFQPSLELIEKFFAEETFAPEDIDFAKAQLEHWKQAYLKMVEYAQEGDIGMAHHVREHLTQVLLDHVLERPHTVHASTIPLCTAGYTCDFRIVERNTDDSLKLYLVEDWKDAERAVRSLPKEIKDLIEGVEIIALGIDEELGINWVHYYLAIEINGVWHTINPLPYGTKVHHW